MTFLKRWELPPKKEQAMPRLDASIALRSLHHDLDGKNELVVPNVVVDLWAECDLLTITKALYPVEYEVKLSRSDFFADRKKTVYWRKRRSPEREHWPENLEHLKWERIEENKHQLLAERDCFPSRFFFVTPQGLVKPDEIPEWAGHIELTPWTTVWRMHRVKDAPRLHNNKVDNEFLYRTARKMVFRYWKHVHRQPGKLAFPE